MLHNFTLLDAGADIGPLLSALKRKPHLWDEIQGRQTTPGSPHKYTKSIFLRWSADQSVMAAFNDLTAIDYPALQELPEVIPLINAVMKLAESSELGRVLITSLQSSGVIAPHADEGKVADHYERFHVSLKSEDGNWFFSKTGKETIEGVHMLPGEIFNFNNKRIHFLENRSQDPRIHLIVDCVSPKFRRERDELSA